MRDYIRDGNGNPNGLGLHRGPNTDAHWKEYHELSVEFLDDDRFAALVALYGRYNFEMTSPIPVRRTAREEKTWVLKVGALESYWLVQSYRDDGSEIERLRGAGERPLYMSPNFFEKHVYGSDNASGS